MAGQRTLGLDAARAAMPVALSRDFLHDAARLGTAPPLPVADRDAAADRAVDLVLGLR